MTDAQLHQSSRAEYSASAGVWAFILGFALGPLGLAAGLVIFGLARDKEQQSFGWFVLLGGIIVWLVLVTIVIVSLGSILEGLLLYSPNPA